MRAPQPPQLNSTADLQQLCTEQLGLCVIGVLNPGVAVHFRHLDNLGAIAMQDSGKVGCFPVHFGVLLGFAAGCLSFQRVNIAQDRDLALRCGWFGRNCL
jgi:hypothetical protein